MSRKLIKTEDGSHTIFVPELGEHYHSLFGAVSESRHIYIDAGFKYLQKESVRIIEFGMGTGLNVLLTYQEAMKARRKVHYHAIEKYPLSEFEIENLNLVEKTFCANPDIFSKIHSLPWGENIYLSGNFTLYKEKADFRKANPPGIFDLVYFDAFAPEVQPKLWTQEMFMRISAITEKGSVLTTYSAKGSIRRNLQAAGFSVEKLPGPMGKREITRALRQD